MCKKAKWLSEEALQRSEERREAKGMGKREKIYPTECRIPENIRRDNKVFFNDKSKEVEESNRIGKSRSLQENWRYQENISCEDRHDKRQKW